MYQLIASRPPVNRIYSAFLAEKAGVMQDTLDMVEKKVGEAIEGSFKMLPTDVSVGFSDRWSDVVSEYNTNAVETAVSVEKLVTIARRLAALPAGFMPHAKLGVLVQKRFEAVLKGEGIDWGNAETLAYATLLDQGFSVRISGQDSRRGTFNHRHCTLVDNYDERVYTPLESVEHDGAAFHAWNSLLSEFGVLGFEYGYSLETPNCLTLWEAQFGDFANGAQVIIDQFISSGETKWNRASGLVMLLPHGYEGQGAEHSSARIERYLQLCASENVVIVYPSTPAQMFHLLRRQMLQVFRKPLVIFTPKSLLRHPACTSTVAEFCQGHFENIIIPVDDISVAKQVLFCTGKIFYELKEECVRRDRSDTAIIRIEQLYPLDSAAVQNVVDLCLPGCQFYWVQEEPENMGAWHYMERQFRQLSVSVVYIGRQPDACPAVGSHILHMKQQADILERAFSAI
jgi:2-oxoglutarate dehydrogenase E1 component